MNSFAALEGALANGYGIETDFRDCCGRLVISHDPPLLEITPSADEFFSLVAASKTLMPLALNIKADGLQIMIKDCIDEYEIKDYFLFDMAIPDALQSLRLGLNIFTRQSDLEPEPDLYEHAKGLWLDSFGDDSWIKPDLISSHLASGKSVCIVSSELHNRDHRPLWERLSSIEISDDLSVLMLCTDYPDEAKEFFKNA